MIIPPCNQCEKPALGYPDDTPKEVIICEDCCNEVMAQMLRNMMKAEDLISKRLKPN